MYRPTANKSLDLAGRRNGRKFLVTYTKNGFVIVKYLRMVNSSELQIVEMGN